MSIQTIKNTPDLAKAIKARRTELSLTIEDAASKVGVGTKTWCRYEAGNAIRTDKVKGICKTLNWKKLPDIEEESGLSFNLEEYKQDECWSKYISETFGEAAAISFIIGSELLLDTINDDLHELSKMPKGTHVGQLSFSLLADKLPKQFLPEYDYDFLYKLKCVLKHLRKEAHYGSQIIAHSVFEELALYLIIRFADLLMDENKLDMVNCGISGIDKWNQWIYDIFDDMDIITCLYSWEYLIPDHCYHFVHWDERQFYMNNLPYIEPPV